MPSLPPAIVPLLSPFASLFDIRTWRQVQVLLTGVILAPGRRTVSTALYVPGLHARGDFALFHHVLSRASWSSLAVSRVLLDQLVQHLVPTGPLRLAVDETPGGAGGHCCNWRGLRGPGAQWGPGGPAPPRTQGGVRRRPA